MRKIKLRDFKKWKDLNKSSNFSLFDYIFHITKQKKVNTDLYFAFLELFWPEFIRNDRYFFLSENYLEEEFDRLINDGANPEYWINLLTVDGFFSEADDWEEKSDALAKALVEIWKIKLEKDFPSVNFIVEYISDKESGDYGLTFYQNQSGIPDAT